MKTIVLVIALLVAGTAAKAQGISPILTECGGKKCSGKFIAANLNLTPEMVTIRAISFGRPGETYKELDPKIHLTLNDMSARVGPKGQHIFFFKVECDTLPCWFAIYTTFTPLHQAQDNVTNIGITMSLPHAVWMCDKAKNCRVQIRKDVFGIGQ